MEHEKVVPRMLDAGCLKKKFEEEENFKQSQTISIYKITRNIEQRISNNEQIMETIRKDNEPPFATWEWGWRYHHLGIPTDKHFEGERYLPQYKFYVSGFETSPFGIEWMRFEPDSPVEDLIKSVPHIAFEVDDLDAELSKHNFEILTYPNSPGEGTRVAMIVHNGAPVELIEFRS